MSRLTTKRRDALPKSDFAFPQKIHRGKRGAKDTEGAYPIDTLARSRSALARGKHNLSARKYHELAERIHKKHPSMRIKVLEKK